MRSIGIVTDSHSSISQQKAAELGISVLPMPFVIDGTEYYEDVTLSREEFYQKLRGGASVSTSQPSVEEVRAIWDEKLAECDEVVYIPISSGLSGSCGTALLLAQKEPYAGRVFVVDNGRVATPQYRTVLDAIELAREGCTGSQIKQRLEAARADMTIYVAVDTLEFLKKGGRISSASAVLGTVLNIKPILQFDVGILHMFQKCRGMKAARKAMIEALRKDFGTKFRRQYEAGDVHLLAATSAGQEETDSWVEEIRKAFPGMDVMCEPLSLGVSCHIGPGGLGIGCSCRP